MIDGKRVCPGCGAENPPDLRFCRTCGIELAADSPEGETLVIDLPQEDPDRIPWYRITPRFVVSLVVGGGFLLWLAIPDFKPHRPQAREKACYANMRVILGAVEMYNMDHEAMISAVNDGMIRSPGGLLVKEQYLKSGISSPETGCSYGTTGDLTGSGSVVCAMHGTVE
jgi:competence protein ComGC